MAGPGASRGHAYGCCNAARPFTTATLSPLVLYGVSWLRAQSQPLDFMNFCAVAAAVKQARLSNAGVL